LNSEQTNHWNNLLRAAVDFLSLEVLNSALDLSLLKRKKNKSGKKHSGSWIWNQNEPHEGRPVPCVMYVTPDNHWGPFCP